MNDTEREAIILNAAWEMIDDMVNWAMFVKIDYAEIDYLRFQTEWHARLFTILLGDFLSDIRAYRGAPVPFDLATPPSGARPSDLTFLFHLRWVCSRQALGSDAEELTAAIEAFAEWLEHEFLAENVNLGDIGLPDANLTISRIRYLKMCGDIGKHNLARLTANARHLRKHLETAGHIISEQDAYLAINDFYRWFQNHIFSYHQTAIAEFLNNIRWAIYRYLRSEFERSWHLTEHATPTFAAYSYRIPASITEPVAVAMYWNVMNHTRRPPYMQQFIVTRYGPARF
ncbi:MAG: hypothetical protein JSR78_05310 [Proteobacteria bacterium]|nr:hypothetical protein [Pseudomonadota bacterium]